MISLSIKNLSSKLADKFEFLNFYLSGFGLFFADSIQISVWIIF